MNNRAVSETLGFVLVFALITGTVGMVYASGMQGLYDAQQSEQTTNVIRGMDVMADNIEDVHYEGAPSRATELRLGDSSLGFGNTISIEISYTSGGNLINSSLEPRPIVYRDGDGTEITYVAGAIIQSNQRTSGMIREPKIDTAEGGGTLIIPQIITRQSGDAQRLSGGSTVLVVSEGRSSAVTHAAIDNNKPVTVTIEDSKRVEAWNRYFDEMDRWQKVEGTDEGVIEYEINNINDLYLHQTRLGIELQS